MKLRVGLALLVIIATLRWLGCDPNTERGPVKHLTNRLWMSKAPRDARDFVFHFMLGQKNKRRFGLMMNASSFRFMGDAINYRLDGHRLTLMVLQDEAKATFDVRTWACKDAPKPFDLCLELKRGRRAVVLYSQRKMTFDAETLGTMPINFESIQDASVGSESLPERTPEWFERLAVPIKADSED